MLDDEFDLLISEYCAAQAAVMRASEKAAAASANLVLTCQNLREHGTDAEKERAAHFAEEAAAEVGRLGLRLARLRRAVAAAFAARDNAANGQSDRDAPDEAARKRAEVWIDLRQSQALLVADGRGLPPYLRRHAELSVLHEQTERAMAPAGLNWLRPS